MIADYYIRSLQFIDDEEKVIHEIIVKDAGDWHTIEIQDGESFVGF